MSDPKTISKFANEIAARQYYHTDEHGNKEDYFDMLRRVAKHVARAEAIDAYKNDNGRYPEWYLSFEGRRRNLLDLNTLDEWIEKEGYTELCAEWEERFHDLMIAKKFSPGGRILAGSGSVYGQLQNCFVLGPSGRYISAAKDDVDSIDGIYELAYKLAKVTKTGGGCGISLNFMRESNSPVQGSQGTSSGPVSFLRQQFNTTLRVIKQGGVRRGAGMATMKVTHPDVLDFITAKDKDREEIEGTIEAFNISLLVTDDFMSKVRKDEAVLFTSLRSGEHMLPTAVYGKYHHPGSKSTSVSGNPNDQTTSKVIPHMYDQSGKVGISARWLWEEITEHAWQTGDPGILFIDRINQYWPFKEVLGELEATNPCGEEPLWPGESCCLGSIVLNNYIIDEDVDWQGLGNDIPTMIRFLDNVVTINVHPLEDTQEWCDRLRRVGLGVMGDAVAMLKLRFGYSTEKANQTRKALALFLSDASLKASESLASQKGAFPFAENLPEHIKVRRNVHMLSIAPTGTISMLCDTSSGIEPVFALAMQRRVGTDYKFRLDPTFEDYLKEHRPDINLEDETQFVSMDTVVGTDALGKAIRDKIMVPQVVKDIMDNHGSIMGLPEFEEENDNLMFETAHDVDPMSHVEVQGYWQKYLDNDQMPMASISKTVNLSQDATVEDIRRVYDLGFDMELKGVTIYRDGSRDIQVLTTDTKVDEVEAEPTILRIPQASIVTRPRTTTGDMTKAEFRDAGDNVRKVYIYIGCDDLGYPLEVFVTDEDGGHDVHPYAAALGKMISLALKHGATPHKIAKKLSRIKGGSMCYSGGIFQSVPAMVGRLLDTAVTNMEVLWKDDMVLEEEECEHNMEEQGGCAVCTLCGYSKCG